MIRRLRRKFILINMTLVSMVLLIVFASVCLSSGQRLYNESFDAMRMALERGPDGFPRFKIGDGGNHPPRRPANTTPVFCAFVGADGTARRADAFDSVEISDALVAEAAAAALADGKETGVLRVLGLRYLVSGTPEGVRIAFADMTAERSSMRRLLLTSLLVGAGGLAAFFGISVFLARWTLRPVQEAWEQQRRFVADASHELKTPLTVILANLGILLSHRGDTIERQLKWVANTRDEADRMKKLVDDLLFLARSDSARARPVYTELSFSDLVWGRLLMFEPVAFEQGVQLESDIAPGATVFGDEAQLGQAAVILLDNACKYAGEGGKVAVRLERQPDRVRLSVFNTGEPIPAQQLPHLFERFYRSDESRTRQKGGYGLGLAIAETIVTAHRGKIAVESGERGTVFTVTLPPAGKGEKLLRAEKP